MNVPTAIVGYVDADISEVITKANVVTRNPSYCRWVTGRFLRLSFRSSLGWFVGLVVLAFALTGLNLIGSYFVKYFSTAASERNIPAYTLFAWLSVAAFLCSAIIVAFDRYFEDKLALKWRTILLSHLLPLYARHRDRAIRPNDDFDHADQRLTDDITLYTKRSLSFFLILLNSTLGLVGFSSVLLSISPRLLLIAFGYAIFGSLTALFIGRPLVRLLNKLSNSEAVLREELIGLKNGSADLATAPAKVAEVLAAQDRIIPVYCRVTGFTSLYDYLKGIIPIIVVAPFYFSGQAEWGIIAQSMVAFGFVVNAFSVIVKEIESISNFLAIVSRLGRLWQQLVAFEDESNSLTETLG